MTDSGRGKGIPQEWENEGDTKEERGMKWSGRTRTEGQWWMGLERPPSTSVEDLECQVETLGFHSVAIGSHCRLCSRRLTRLKEK